MRKKSTGWIVDSAGTGGWHIGEPPYGPMQASAKRHGYDMSDLRARQFDVSDFDRFDLILAMDAQNMTDIEALRPEGCATPVRRFANQDVPDPYYTREFDEALTLIEKAADVLIRTAPALCR